MLLYQTRQELVSLTFLMVHGMTEPAVNVVQRNQILVKCRLERGTTAL